MRKLWIVLLSAAALHAQGNVVQVCDQQSPKHCWNIIAAGTLSATRVLQLNDTTANIGATLTANAWSWNSGYDNALIQLGSNIEAATDPSYLQSSTDCSHPATYSGGTTYALGDLAWTGSGTIYTSLSAGNVGHALSNPTYWSPYCVDDRTKIDWFGLEGDFFRVKGKGTNTAGDYFDFTRFTAASGALPLHQMQLIDSSFNPLLFIDETAGYANTTYAFHGDVQASNGMKIDRTTDDGSGAVLQMTGGGHSDTVWDAPIIRPHNTGVDYFSLSVPSAHKLSLTDSSANVLLLVDETSGYSTTQYNFVGTVGATAGYTSGLGYYAATATYNVFSAPNGGLGAKASTLTNAAFWAPLGTSTYPPSTECQAGSSSDGFGGSGYGGLAYQGGAKYSYCNPGSGWATVDFSATGGSNWTQGTGIIYPTTSGDKVLVNRTTDDTSGAYLQVTGGGHSDTVWSAPIIRMQVLGTDYFSWYLPSAHNLQLLDSSSNVVMGLDETGGAGDSIFRFNLASTDVSLASGGVVAGGSFASATATSNASVGSFAAIASNYVAFSSNHTGSGTTLPMAFFMGSNRPLNILTSGAVLVNRSSDDGSGSALQVAGNLSLSSSGRCAGCGVQTQTDVTGSRTSGTVYHNTGNYPIFVNVVMSISSSGFDSCFTDSSSTPLTRIVQFGGIAGAGGAQWSASFWVLPGNYYDCQTSGTIVSWIESI